MKTLRSMTLGGLTTMALALVVSACSEALTSPAMEEGSAQLNMNATASVRTAQWLGNGATWDGEEFVVTDSRCEASEGQPYLYWVLTANGKESVNGATIIIDGVTSLMHRVSKGSFKFTQTFEEGFEAPNVVTASYTNGKSANLVISHGCTGEDDGGPSDPTGLTIQFLPMISNQYVWYCNNGSEPAVCVSPSRTVTSAAGVLQEYNIPLTTLNSENSATGLFSITVMAPQSLPFGSKVGPGEGVTCLQRSGPTVAGTVNGVNSGDWTGAGVFYGTQYLNYWYTGCSLNPGVTHAYFYGYITSPT